MRWTDDETKTREDVVSHFSFWLMSFIQEDEAEHCDEMDFFALIKTVLWFECEMFVVCRSWIECHFFFKVGPLANRVSYFGLRRISGVGGKEFCFSNIQVHNINHQLGAVALLVCCWYKCTYQFLLISGNFFTYLSSFFCGRITNFFRAICNWT